MLRQGTEMSMCDCGWGPWLHVVALSLNMLPVSLHCQLSNEGKMPKRKTQIYSFLICVSLTNCLISSVFYVSLRTATFYTAGLMSH